MAELPDITAPPARARQRAPAGGNAGPPWRRLGARPAALPLVLLLLALSALFLFGGERELFYRGGLHDWNSSRALLFAENLSFQDNLLVFFYRSRDADGSVSYPEPYNRFPLGGYALIKLATLPFGDTDFRAQIYAARILMLLLFSAAAVLAYHSLSRITGSRWDALTATLLAFSSYYLLYYSDKIYNEITIDLFGVMMVFHGMVIYVQERRFRQLLVKSGLALLLGWHAYAILMAFVVLGLAADLLKARHIISTHPFMLCNLKQAVATLRRSRYLLLGLATLLFGVAILASNFGREYFALSGEVPFRELPSVISAAKRLSLISTPDYYPTVELLKPERLVLDQFYRIAVITLPYAINPYEIKGYYPRYNCDDYPAIAVGILALGFGLAGLVGIRRRPARALLLGTLFAAGLCWAVVVRGNIVGHDHESVFHIGIPLAGFTLALLGLRRWSGGRLAPYFAVVALVAFVISVSEMAGVGESRKELAVEAGHMDDYAAIRELADDGRAIYIPHHYRASGTPEVSGRVGAPWAQQYFLSGKTLVYTDQSGTDPPPPQAGDYLLLTARADNPALLTPDNRYVFLYDWALYDQWQRTAYQDAAPIVADAWRVYLGAGNLTYQSPECAHREARFLLHFIPRHAADLPLYRREHGFDNRDFDFELASVKLTDGTCVIERPLPDYDIVAIRTGQYTDAGRIWEGEYRLPAP